MQATLESIEQLTPTIKTFWFCPKEKFRYIAGQFIEMTLPGEHDQRGPRRWFTLSSSPTEPLIGITTSFAGNAGSSFKKQLHDLPLGTTVLLSEPMGDFVLPKDTTIPLVFVANGIGITPMRSMITWLIDKGESRDITLVYAGRSAAGLPFLDFLSGTHVIKLQTILGRRLEVSDILATVVDKPDYLVYLAGSEPVVEKLGHQLEKSGVVKHRIVIDFFSGYPEL